MRFVSTNYLTVNQTHKQMTLREYYNNLPTAKQRDYRAKWLQLTGKSRANFYVMLKEASESDIRLFAAVTGVEPIDIFKPVQSQLDIFSTKPTKYRKAL